MRINNNNTKHKTKSKSFLGAEQWIRGLHTDFQSIPTGQCSDIIRAVKQLVRHRSLARAHYIQLADWNSESGHVSFILIKTYNTFFNRSNVLRLCCTSLLLKTAPSVFFSFSVLTAGLIWPFTLTFIQNIPFTHCCNTLNLKQSKEKRARESQIDLKKHFKNRCCSTCCALSVVCFWGTHQRSAPNPSPEVPLGLFCPVSQLFHWKVQSVQL